MSLRQNGPTFIGIGAAHAGLSTVAGWLAEHPEIADRVPALHFFSTDSYEKKGLLWYEAQLQSTREKPNFLTGECTAQYLYDSDTPARIVSDYPDTKLFVLLRHPVDRMVAEYVSCKSTDRTALEHSFVTYLSQHPALFTRSQYATALAPYFAYYSPRQLLVLHYEEIVLQPLAMLERLYHFLGVEKTFVPKALRGYAPPPEESKNPGLLKRLYRQGRRLYKRLRPPVVLPVFPTAPRVADYLTTTERTMYEQALLPDVDQLSHLLSTDMAMYWSLRVEETVS